MSQLPKNVRVSKLPSLTDARMGVVKYKISYNVEVDIAIAEEAAKNEDYLQQTIEYGIEQVLHNVRESLKNGNGKRWVRYKMMW